ncbi:MAG: glycosyltransferase family 39 protein [Myxococcota bacterium]|nr:glycosyltransferase family 39 protein [Myxococcota bacterium]
MRQAQLLKHASSAFAVFWALVGGLTCAWMIPLEANMLEEGIALHLSQRMMGGEHLFRDLASFTGPLPFELLALLFRIFGDDLMVARGAVAVMHGAACAAVFGLARNARHDDFAHVAAGLFAATPVLLFPLYSLYFYSVTTVHIAVVATWAASRGIGSNPHAFAAGALVALSALCKQNLGPVLALLLGACLVVLPEAEVRWRRIGAFVAGGAAITVATLTLYGVRGDIGVLFDSLVTLPLTFRDSFDSAYVNMWPPGHFREDIFIDRARYVPAIYGFKYGVFGNVGFIAALATQLLYATPFLALGLTVFNAARRGVSKATWVHSALLLALIPSLFPRTDWGHLVYVLPAALIQLALVARAVGNPLAARTSAVALLIGLSGATISTGEWLHANAGPQHFGPKVPVRPVNQMLKTPELPRLIRTLRRRVAPGEPIYVARSEPLIYFATGASNPTPYSGVIPGIDEEQERTIIAGLNQVRFAVMSDIDQPMFLYYSDELPNVWGYLERHFRVAPGSKPGWLTLLERSKDRGPVLVDLFEIRDRGHPWVRQATERTEPIEKDAPRIAARRNRRVLSFWSAQGGGGIDFEIDVPEESVFQADVGLAKVIGLRREYSHPKRVDMIVSIRAAGSSDVFEPIARETVHTGMHRGHAWRPIQADLAEFAGRRVELRLEMRPHRPIQGRDQLVWFGSPRIAGPPAR